VPSQVKAAAALLGLLALLGALATLLLFAGFSDATRHNRGGEGVFALVGAITLAMTVGYVIAAVQAVKGGRLAITLSGRLLGLSVVLTGVGLARTGTLSGVLPVVLNIVVLLLVNSTEARTFRSTLALRDTV
jgi:hypothetical protein